MADRVDTVARLAQWKIENFGPCSYKKSDPFKLGIWNWSAVVSIHLFHFSLYIWIKLEILNSFIFRYFSIVRNRFFSIHLFPEPSKVSKDHPPVARFILRVSVAGSSRKFIVSPGKVNMHQSFFVNSLCCWFHYMTFYLYKCDKTVKFVYGDFFSYRWFSEFWISNSAFSYTFNGIVIFYWNDLSDLQSSNIKSLYRLTN